MKRKKRNAKIIEMSLFNIGGKSKPEIDLKLRKQIEETNKKNREEIEKRKYTKDSDKRFEELKRQKQAEARQKQAEPQPTEPFNPPNYSPANKLAQQAKRAISKQELDSNVTTPSKYDPYSYSKRQRITGNKKVNTANYLSNEELLQRVYFMFGMSYNNSYRF